MTNIKKILFTIIALISVIGAYFSSSIVEAALKITGGSGNNVKMSTLQKGLVGHWTLDGITGATDKTPYSNNGTAQGGITVGGATDRFGIASRATTFDGSNYYIDIGSTNPLGGSTEISFSAFVKITEYPAVGKEYRLMELGSTPTYPNSVLVYIDSNGILRLNINNSDTAAFNTTPLNTWFHIVGVWKSGSYSYVYIDNVASSKGTSATASIPSASITNNIGRSPWGGANYYFKGLISDIRIYNRVLSTTEITQLYDSYRPKITFNNITDIDGNVYGTIKIGTQTWMTSNLMTTKYRDGTAITRGPTGATWDGTDHSYYAYPPNTANTAEESLANITANNLGFVYQQGAVLNAKGICPSGWHVPSDAEYKTLVEYLGTANCDGTGASYGWFCAPAGASLKEAGTAHWSSGNTGTNTSGFSAVGTGYRGTSGSFNSRSVYSDLWSSSSTLDRSLYCSESRVYRSTDSAAYGFSVRCLKD